MNNTLRSKTVNKRWDMAPVAEVLGYVSRIVGSRFLVACSKGDQPIRRGNLRQDGWVRGGVLDGY